MVTEGGTNTRNVKKQGRLFVQGEKTALPG